MVSDDIGYKRPPKKSQFQKGQSGNPNGRPKRKGFEEEVLDELNSLITISENGKPSKVSKQSALIKRLVAGALSGDIQAVRILLGRLPQIKSLPQEHYPKFMLKLGDPKVSNRARLQQLERERAEIIQELDICEKSDDK